MNTNSYRNYIRKSFFKFAVMIIILLFFIITSFLYINLKFVSENANKKYNKNISEKFEKDILDYQLNIEKFTKNEDIKKALKQMDKKSITKVNRLLYSFCNENELKASFALIDNNSNIISSNLFLPNREMLLKSNTYKSLKERLSMDSKIIMFPSHINYTNNQEGDLIIAKSIEDEKGNLGFLIFDIFDDSIYNLVSVYPLSEVIIIDKYDNIIYTSGRQVQDPNEKYPQEKYKVKKLEKSNTTINGKSYHINKTKIDDANIIVYTLMITDSEKLIIKYSFFYMTIVMLLMIFLLIPLTYKLTEKSNIAIDELQKSIKEIGRGNMDYKIDKSIFTEFSQLYYKFKQIVMQRENLLKANSELIERKRLMEIKRLEEQINPHFIFNVLETLRYEILLDKDKASEMVMSFAEILRYSIYYHDTIVSLETDIEYINDYLLLQKMRYNDSLQYKIEIPEELFNIKIPKLLLQPVVENSLKHGMKKTSKVMIIIKAKMQGNNLVLSVEDDGGGMSIENLIKLEKSLENIDIQKEHIGLFNTHRIIKLLYGEKYGLKIQSKENIGTKVVITIPTTIKEG